MPNGNFWDTLLGAGKKVLGTVIDSNPISATIADIIGLDLDDKDACNAKAQEILQDPTLLLEFKSKMLDHKVRLMELQAQEMESARSAYKIEHVQADKIAERVFKFNMYIALILVIAQIFAVKYLDPTSVVVVANVLGYVINALLNERSQVIGFYFGSSLGSKTKDLINQKKRGENEKGFTFSGPHDRR